MSNQRNQDWLVTRYWPMWGARPTQRHGTMTAAIARLLNGSPLIVETGCTREPDDWGAGMSTQILGAFAAFAGGRLYTVDNDPLHIAKCKALTQEYAGHISYNLDDSVHYLETSAPRAIDMLYLDSLDYPYGKLLDAYGGKSDIDAAKATLAKMSEGEIIMRHGHVIHASQAHALAELEAAHPKLNGRCLVLIDDAGLPGGGKARLAVKRLRELGFVEVATEYQTLWART